MKDHAAYSVRCDDQERAMSAYCRAAMNYALSQTEVSSVEVDIYNGREADLSWQTHGFELCQHTSAVDDWADDKQVAAIYYAEAEQLARQMTRCDVALIGGHISRNPTSAARHIDFAPIQYVHSDFTQSYGALLRDRFVVVEEGARQALERAGVDADIVVHAKRLLVLQFWRNVGPVTMDLPLALCDTRTVPVADLHSFTVPEYGGESLPFDTFGVSAPLQTGAHRWYTFPDMHRDEAIVFRTYDSELAAQGGHFWTPHSAFAEQRLARAPARHSIEVRATCVFS
ncbi:MAG: CmcJ/NvfI family oxidoreductase [Pseudomonadota bacterium]